jgi:hypothetical protein
MGSGLACHGKDGRGQARKHEQLHNLWEASQSSGSSPLHLDSGCASRIPILLLPHQTVDKL